MSFFFFPEWSRTGSGGECGIPGEGNFVHSSHSRVDQMLQEPFFFLSQVLFYYFDCSRREKERDRERETESKREKEREEAQCNHELPALTFPLKCRP